MKVFGWALILLFGGGMVYMLIDWAVRSLNGYYVGGESMAALAITGLVGVVALIPIGIGIWLVRKEARGSQSNPVERIEQERPVQLS